MMQDKNNLDDMAKKYKEEMMRLYSRKPKPAASASQQRQNVQSKTVQPVQPVQSIQTVPAAQTFQASQAVQSIQTGTKPVSVSAAAKLEQTASVPTISSSDSISAERKRPARIPAVNYRAVNHRDLSNPPMPEIPAEYPDAGVKKEAPQSSSSSKFPSADEILRTESAAEPVRTPPPSSAARESRSVLQEEHNQGNYSAASPHNADMDGSSGDMQLNESYPNDNTDFSAVDSDDVFASENPPDMSGQGYLQIEVTTASGAIPVRGATVIISETTDGVDSLIGMVITDENGTTPIVPLSAPPQSLSESPDPLEKPYSEYNISVYKKGFYSIPKLTVPIFDTIKSIQPVSVIPLAESELNGAEIPNERR